MSKEIFGKTCALCGSSDDLQIHHISYRPEITHILCVDCHRKHHGHGVGKSDLGHPAKVETISIGDEHEKWIVDNSINLSRFVQRKIDEKIEEIWERTK